MKLSIKTTIGVIAMAGFLNTGLNAENKDRKVFAHYMTCFTSRPEFYKREIMLAQHYGIDGFALNCGEWFKPVEGNALLTDRNVGEVMAYLGIEAIAVHAEVERCVAQADEPR